MSYEASTISNTMRLAYTTDATPPLYTSPSPTLTYNNPNAAAGDAVAVKRKRGRPKKHAPDVSVSVSVSDSVSPAAMLPPGQAAAPALSSGKRRRGRPPGSLNKQHPAASGLPGVGFMPHILDVKAGEDVLTKMMWFSQNSTRALCVLSANGAVSNVTLRQSPISDGTVTYEGNFEILSLSGSFMVSEVGGQRSRTGGLSVALSGPDGRVLGGNLAGLLTAASPVQVIVGSFVPASQKQAKTGAAAGNNEAEVVNVNAPHSESSGGGLGSPFDHSNTQAMANITWR